MSTTLILSDEPANTRAESNIEGIGISLAETKKRKIIMAAKMGKLLYGGNNKYRNRKLMYRANDEICTIFIHLIKPAS